MCRVCRYKRRTARSQKCQPETHGQVCPAKRDQMPMMFLRALACTFRDFRFAKRPTKETSECVQQSEARLCLRQARSPGPPSLSYWLECRPCDPPIAKGALEAKLTASRRAVLGRGEVPAWANANFWRFQHRAGSAKLVVAGRCRPSAKRLSNAVGRKPARIFASFDACSSRVRSHALLARSLRPPNVPSRIRAFVRRPLGR